MPASRVWCRGPCVALFACCGGRGGSEPGRGWGRTFHERALRFLGLLLGPRRRKQRVFALDQQETHWRKCCHSPRGGFNWPPPRAGCEIKGGRGALGPGLEAPRVAEGERRAQGLPTQPGARSPVRLPPSGSGSDSSGNVTAPLLPQQSFWKVRFTKGERT